MKNHLLHCTSFKEHKRNVIGGFESVLKAYNRFSLSSYGNPEVLVHGHKSLSLQANKSVLKMTVEHILKAECFDQIQFFGSNRLNSAFISHFNHR